MWPFYGFSSQAILNIKNLSPNVDILIFARCDNNMNVEMMLQKDGQLQIPKNILVVANHIEVAYDKFVKATYRLETS